MEQRLQCLNCKKVRYRRDEQDNISVPVPVRRLSTAPTPEIDDLKSPKERYESVTLKECLDIFTGAEAVELTCSSCKSSAGFTKRSLFKTFPAVLAINARRFELVNWVPTKLDIPVIVDDKPFSMDAYKSYGLQPGEQELEEDGLPATSSRFTPNEAALGQLEAMGFPKIRCEKALHATGNSDADAAMTWLFSHMDDADIDDPMELIDPGSTGASTTGVVDPQKIETLGAMGFGPPQARKALTETSGDVERAVEWLFNHPDDQGDIDMGDSAPTEKETPGSDQLPANFQLQSIVCHKGASIHGG